MSKITIKQDEKDVVPTEVLAKSICAIAAGVKALRKGSLGERALLLLISENCFVKGRKNRVKKCKVSTATIKMVLDSMENLQQAYTK